MAIATSSRGRATMPGDVLMKAQQALARPAKELGKRKYPLEHTDPVAHHQHHTGHGTPATSRNGTPTPGGSGSTAQQTSSRRGSERFPRRRNIDRVYFGTHEIRTWYYSPYPFEEEEWASLIAANPTASAGPPAAASARADSAQAGPSSAPNVAAAGTQKAGGARGDHAPALQALESPGALVQQHGRQGGSASVGTGTHHHGSKESPLANALWICDGCFKYMRTYAGYRAHKKQCTFTHPPGRKVYQRGAHTIWEVDGSEQKLYAQNLSLFGKLFIDHKTIYFDVEPFLFFVLTDASPQFDHVLGFFSKEKVSYDDYNLACIVTLPPAQKKGFGTLMIEFSYYLSSLAATGAGAAALGTPERPLSDLGLQGYLSYWSGVALRSLAIIFFDPDPDIRLRLLPATYDTDSPVRSRFHAQAAANTAALAEERLREECARLRRALLGLSTSLNAASGQSQSQGQADGIATPATGDERSDRVNAMPTSARRGMKGWAGEVPRLRPGSRQAAMSDGSASTGDQTSGGSIGGLSLPDVDGHPLLQLDDADASELTSLETTLERLAQAINLRIDDLCFALSECGLLRRKVTTADEEAEVAAAAGGQAVKMEDAGVSPPTSGYSVVVVDDKAKAAAISSAAAPVTLVLTREGVREALRRLRVKRPIFDVQYARIWS